MAFPATSLLLLARLTLLPELSLAFVGGNVSDPNARNIGSRSGGYIYVAPNDWQPQEGARVWAWDSAELWIQGKLTQGKSALWETGSYQFSSNLGPLTMGDHSSITCDGGWFCNFYFHNQWASASIGAYSRIVTLESATLYIDDEFHVGDDASLELFENAHFDTVKGSSFRLGSAGTFFLDRSVNVTLEGHMKVGDEVRFKMDGGANGRFFGGLVLDDMTDFYVGKQGLVLVENGASLSLLDRSTLSTGDFAQIILGGNVSLVVNKQSSVTLGQGAQLRFNDTDFAFVDDGAGLALGDFASLNVFGGLAVTGLGGSAASLALGPQANVTVLPGALLHVTIGQGIRMDVGRNARVVVAARCVLRTSIEVAAFSDQTWTTRHYPSQVICY